MDVELIRTLVCVISRLQLLICGPVFYPGERGFFFPS